MINFPEIKVFCQCDEDLTGQCSTDNCQNICSGVIVFRNLPELYNIFNYSSGDLDLFYCDQDYLIYNFKKLSIQKKAIDRNIFLNGAKKDLLTKKFTLPADASLIHFNYLIGLEKKESMKFQGLWFI